MKQPDWKSVLQQTSEYALEFLRKLPERGVQSKVPASEVYRSLSRPVPEKSSLPTDVIAELTRTLEPGITAMPSGRFFGWVIGGALPSALAADWLTSTWDQNAGSADGTPAAAAVEQVALEWILELCDLPRHASAALVTGGQMANTTCLAAARGEVLHAHAWDVEAKGLPGSPRVHVLVGAERHDTITRSLRLLGLGAANACAVDTDSQGRMRPDALAKALDGVDGPTIICAQAGNVNTGAIDPMSEIVQVVERHRSRGPQGGTWLHVDGAFGLWARASAKLRGSIAGVERADSWATDAHKWLNTPYDCGVAITSHPEAHRRALGMRAAYLPDPDKNAVRTPWDFSPELSRRARGIAVYAALHQLGRSGVEELVDLCCALARRFAEKLSPMKGVRILNQVSLNQVLVRFQDPAGKDDDAHTDQVIHRVKESGVCYMTGTTWRGQSAMRISVCNWSTDEEDVDLSVKAILRAHQ